MMTSGRLFPRLVLALFCGGGVFAARAVEDVRFSATLTSAQRDRAGLTPLSADNIAVIDGLVRQDLAASKFRDNDVDHTRFSERRTARERELAGLDRLTPAQVTELDTLVGQRISGVAPEADATIGAGSSTRTAVKPSTSTDQLDIHGEISFTYGWGKGGDFRGGDIVLTYDDPKGRYSILAGYSEYRGKGLPPDFYGLYGPYRAYPGALPFTR